MRAYICNNCESISAEEMPEFFLPTAGEDLVEAYHACSPQCAGELLFGTEEEQKMTEEEQLMMDFVEHEDEVTAKLTPRKEGERVKKSGFADDHIEAERRHKEEAAKITEQITGVQRRGFGQRS